jgi:hypothetical protein
MVSGVLATCLALSAAFVSPYVGRAESDVNWSWYDYRMGYWIWLGSAVVLTLVSFAVHRVHFDRRTETLPGD